jgi:hypothetical protein
VNTLQRKLMLSALLVAVCGIAIAARPAKTWSAATAGAEPSGQAQAGAAMSGAMSNAPVQIRQLAWLVGEWKAQEAYQSSALAPTGATGTGTLSVKVGAKGLSLDTNYRGKYQAEKSQQTVASRGDIAFDLGTHGYAIFSAESRGTAMSRLAGTGDWNWQVLSFHGDMLVNGKKMAARLLFYNMAHDSFSTELSLGPTAKELRPALVANYTRVKPGA